MEVLFAMYTMTSFVHVYLTLKMHTLNPCVFCIKSHQIVRAVSHIGIGIIYYPPNADGFFSTIHIFSSHEILSQHPEAGLIVLFDFKSLNDAPNA